MMTQIERLAARMFAMPRSVVREAISMWEKRGDELRASLETAGWVVVDEATGVAAMPDGREIMRVDGVAYVLPLNVHHKRLATEMAQRREAHQTMKSVIGTEALSQMVCPKCGDSLLHTTVCPKCAAGKLGYRHRYTCVCGAVDMVSKEAL